MICASSGPAIKPLPWKPTKRPPPDENTHVWVWVAGRNHHKLQPCLI